MSQATYWSPAGDLAGGTIAWANTRATADGTVWSPDPTDPAQYEIRRRLQANERKRKRGYKSAKPRGSKWVLQQQAMCALYGHLTSPISMGKCVYCRAEMG